MIPLLVAVLLAVHGFVHAAIYALPDPGDPVPKPDRHPSWAMSALHVPPRPAYAASVWLAWMVLTLFTAAATALLIGAAWWAPAALLAASVALALKMLWFHPRLTVGVLIDLGLLAAVSAGWPVTQ